MKVNKFFFSKCSLSQIILSKCLSRNLYPKYFVRNVITLETRKKILLVDNYFLSFLTISDIYKNLFSSSLLKVGCSLVTDLIIYKSSKLRFFFFGLGTNVKNKNIASSFSERLKVWFNFNENFFLYKVTRGGYLGFSKSIFGFVPQIHILLYEGQFYKHKNYIIFQAISGSNYKRIGFSTVKVYGGGITKNFVKSSKKQRKVLLSSLKFIFTYQFLFTKKWLEYFISTNFQILNKKKSILKYTVLKLLKHLN
jgi:hypothetical protein